MSEWRGADKLFKFSFQTKQGYAIRHLWISTEASAGLQERLTMATKERQTILNRERGL